MTSQTGAESPGGPPPVICCVSEQATLLPGSGPRQATEGTTAGAWHVLVCGKCMCVESIGAWQVLVHGRSVTGTSAWQVRGRYWCTAGAHVWQMQMRGRYWCMVDARVWQMQVRGRYSCLCVANTGAVA